MRLGGEYQILLLTGPENSFVENSSQGLIIMKTFESYTVRSQTTEAVIQRLYCNMATQINVEQ